MHRIALQVHNCPVKPPKKMIVVIIGVPDICLPKNEAQMERWEIHFEGAC